MSIKENPHTEREKEIQRDIYTHTALTNLHCRLMWCRVSVQRINAFDNVHQHRYFHSPCRGIASLDYDSLWMLALSRRRHRHLISRLRGSSCETSNSFWIGFPFVSLPCTLNFPIGLIWLNCQWLFCGWKETFVLICFFFVCVNNATLSSAINTKIYFFANKYKKQQNYKKK